MYKLWNGACSNSPLTAPCFVSSGSSQWSGRKVDLTDHPWVMMMRGLLLLKPQEVRVCSCRGSSTQFSSPSTNRPKTELPTCGFRTPLCSASAANQRAERLSVCSSWSLIRGFTAGLDALRWIIGNKHKNIHFICSLRAEEMLWIMHWCNYLLFSVEGHLDVKAVVFPGHADLFGVCTQIRVHRPGH